VFFDVFNGCIVCINIAAWKVNLMNKARRAIILDIFHVCKLREPINDGRKYNWFCLGLSWINLIRINLISFFYFFIYSIKG
jgi:hypothetical protein